MIKALLYIVRAVSDVGMRNFRGSLYREVAYDILSPQLENNVPAWVSTKFGFGK